MELSLWRVTYCKRKVLLILSSIIKSRKFETGMKIFGISRIREEKIYPEVWVAIVLFIPEAMREPDNRIKQFSSHTFFIY